MARFDANRPASFKRAFSRLTVPVKTPTTTRSSPRTKDAPNEVGRPVLKWAGGKSRLVKEVCARLPSEINTFFEPFVGSAAVFFALASRGSFRRAVLSDANPELIEVYTAIQTQVTSVIQLLKRYPYDRDFYYEIRAKDPSKLDPAERAARTIYLNKAGYNGLYRVNSKGLFNVPFGRHVNPNICDEPRLLSAAHWLKGVKLLKSDFEKACRSAKPGDAVYFDPPYVPLSKTANFTAYQSEGFADAEQQRLANLFHELAKRGVAAVLSNSDMPRTRELYSGLRVDSLQVTRPINSKSSQRGNVGEILVSNQRESSTKVRRNR
jgi:DNA adenine methylase